MVFGTPPPDGCAALRGPPSPGPGRTSDPAQAATYPQVCATTEDWSTFAAQFAGSKHKANRELHEFLVEDILPDVLPQLEVRDRQRREARGLVC